MTDAELHDAILADPEARALAAAGDDGGVAARMAAVLPPMMTTAYINERGIYAAFANPLDGLAVMGGLRAVAAGNPAATPPVPANPIVAAALQWLAPNNGGIDLGNGNVRAMLDQMAAAGAITAAQAATLKAQAERPASVSADDVSRAMAPDRPNGKVA